MNTFGTLKIFLIGAEDVFSDIGKKKKEKKRMEIEILT
jgi:hypothetical protein